MFKPKTAKELHEKKDKKNIILMIERIELNENPKAAMLLIAFLEEMDIDASKFKFAINAAKKYIKNTQGLDCKPTREQIKSVISFSIPGELVKN